MYSARKQYTSLNTAAAFFTHKNEISKRKCKKKITFKITPLKIKYLGINLTKKVKDFDSENYKILIKETEEDSKKWKGISCSWIEELTLLKWTHYSK